jgi:hypothetical protein
MAFSHGRKFRRLAAQALSADPGEMRALRRRILPPRADGAAPVLRVETEADCQAAPAVIVAAFFADEITADEAIDLLRPVDTTAWREQAEQARRDAQRARWDAKFLRGLVEGPRLWGMEPPEGLLQRVNTQLAEMGEETIAAPSCAAASDEAALVNIRKNTSAAADAMQHMNVRERSRRL